MFSRCRATCSVKVSLGRKLIRYPCCYYGGSPFLQTINRLANILRRQVLNNSRSQQLLPTSLQQWLAQQGLGNIEQTESLAGGSINQVLQVTTTTDEHFVLKLNPNCADDFFLAEARSLDRKSTRLNSRHVK